MRIAYGVEPCPWAIRLHGRSPAYSLRRLVSYGVGAKRFADGGGGVMEAGLVVAKDNGDGLSHLEPSPVWRGTSEMTEAIHLQGGAL